MPKIVISHNKTLFGISNLRKRLSGFNPARNALLCNTRINWIPEVKATLAELLLSENHWRLYTCQCLTVSLTLWMLQQTNIAATLSRLQGYDVRRDNRGPCLRFTDPRSLFALHVLDRFSWTDQVRGFIQASWQTVGHISISRFEGITYIRLSSTTLSEMDSTLYPSDGDTRFFRNAGPYPAIYTALHPIWP